MSVVGVILRIVGMCGIIVAVIISLRGVIALLLKQAREMKRIRMSEDYQKTYTSVIFPALSFCIIVVVTGGTRALIPPGRRRVVVELLSSIPFTIVSHDGG